MTKKQHPLDRLQWVDPSTLHSNDYNPNRVFSTELDLLRTSILESGWTQPVVVTSGGEIVDGFHRWTLASTDERIKEVSGGLVPVVVVDEHDRSTQIMATVRHNRARGQHGILKMSSIVVELRSSGVSDDEISRRLGMEEEEIDRLADARSSPEAAGRDSFGRGWVPDPKSILNKPPLSK